MIWWYRLFLPVALLLALPGAFLRMRRRGGYALDWPHRCGYLPTVAPKPPQARRLWLHAVSVGEVNALSGLVEALSAQGGWQVVLSTTTSTGYARLKALYSGHPLVGALCLFPMDLWPCSARAWERWRPDVVGLLEGELWPEHLHQAHRRGVPVAILNARLSDRSFRRYRALPWAAPWLLGKVSLATAASPSDADRLRSLHPALNLHDVGSIKADSPVGPVLSPPEREQLRAELGFPPGTFLFAGLSTWPGEEIALAQAASEVMTHFTEPAKESGQTMGPPIFGGKSDHHAPMLEPPAIGLLLIPRHAERRSEILTELRPLASTVTLRSTGETHPGHDLRAAHRPVAEPEARPDGTEARRPRIYLADTTGEMVRLMQAADAVFIGKTLPPHHEGQTPLEAAALGLPMLLGPQATNFRSLTDSLLAEGAARRLQGPAELATALRAWLADPAARASLGQRAKTWHQAQRGAAAKTAKLLRDLPEPTKQAT